MSVNWDDLKDYNWTIENNLLKTKLFSLSLNDIESFKVKRPFWSYLYESVMGTFVLGLLIILFNFNWKQFIAILIMLFVVEHIFSFMTKAKILDIQCKGKHYRLKGYFNGEWHINNLIKRLDSLLSSK